MAASEAYRDCQICIMPDCHAGKAKETLSMDEYSKEMQGIYSTSVCESTIDESPMAYKSAEEIESLIGDTVEIVKRIKPIYNFKAK